MKGTAACIIWYTLLDCREDFNISHKGCPGCRVSLIEDKKKGYTCQSDREHPCDTCIFWNIKSMRETCTSVGMDILKAMENV